jgi:hypothetical protein
MALVELGRFDRQEAHIVQSAASNRRASPPSCSTASIADGSYLLIPVRVMVDDEDLAPARKILLENPA